MLWVARTCRATHSTLAGYRSALGHVLRLTTGYCPGECRVLRQLIQSFKRTQPLPSSRIPSWDVNLVLSIFCDFQCSDDNLSLHLLTEKTVFLLALASGERRSALAACAYLRTFDQDGMVVSFFLLLFRKVILCAKMSLRCRRSKFRSCLTTSASRYVRFARCCFT